MNFCTMLSEEQQILSERLRSLIDLIVEEAGNNSTFYKKVENVLSELAPTQRAKSIIARKKSKKEINFNHVSILQQHGEEKLVQELDELAYETLSKMSVRYKIYRSVKESNKVDKTGLIEAILKHAKQKLNVGSVFLRN